MPLPNGASPYHAAVLLLGALAWRLMESAGAQASSERTRRDVCLRGTVIAVDSSDRLVDVRASRPAYALRGPGAALRRIRPVLRVDTWR